MIVVNKLDALYDLVLIIFNELLGPNFALVIQDRIANPANILHQVLSEAVHKALDVFCFSQFLHVLKTALDTFPVV